MAEAFLTSVATSAVVRPPGNCWSKAPQSVFLSSRVYVERIEYVDRVVEVNTFGAEAVRAIKLSVARKVATATSLALMTALR